MKNIMETWNPVFAKLGDAIREKEGYKNPELIDINAIYYYLIQKYHWLPNQVRDMSLEDLKLVLAEEIFSFEISFPEI
jgi:hypothetical protein